LDKLCRSCHGNKKGGIQIVFGFLSSNFMKLCRNIHRSVWQLLEGWKKFKMAFWILSTRQKLPHTTVNIPTMFHEVWWKKSKSFLNPPFFYFYGNCGKVYHTDSNFFEVPK
jgi:hypothetical protein